jgi:predicted nucleotidyltransferase
VTLKPARKSLLKHTFPTVPLTFSLTKPLDLYIIEIPNRRHRMSPELRSAIDSITAQLIAKYKPEKIILFGSAARGDATPDSDADFLIIKKDTPYKGRDRMIEVSRLIDRDIPVDFLVYRPDEFEKRLKMGDPFLEIVVAEGKVLYG